MNKIKIPEFLPQALLISGAFLRIAGMAAGSIWYDEAYSLKLATMPLLEMVQVAILDFNPPGFEILLWPFIRIFGANLFGLRFLSLGASLAGLWITWLLIKDLNIYQKSLAAGLIAFLPIGIWAAQDGRNYALFATLYLAGFWLIKNKRWLGMMSVMGLLCYLHLTGIFYAAALFISAIIQDKKDLPKLVLYGSVVAVLYIPELIILSRTSSLDFWLTPVTITSSINLAMFVGLIHNQWAILFAVIFWISLIGSCLIVLGPWINSLVNPVTLRIGSMVTTWLKLKPIEQKTEDHNQENTALLFWAIGPIIFMGIAGNLFQPVIFYRPIVGVVYPICLLFAIVLTPKRLTLTTWILPYSWIMLILISLIGWSPTLKGGGLDHLAMTINQELKNGDIVYHATATSYLPMEYYLDNPGYLLDQNNEHDGLLQDPIQDKFNINKAALEDLDYSRAWIVWARDPILSDTADQRMADYIKDAQYIGSARYFQFSEIQLYLKESDK